MKLLPGPRPGLVAVWERGLGEESPSRERHAAAGVAANAAGGPTLRAAVSGPAKPPCVRVGGNGDQRVLFVHDGVGGVNARQMRQQAAKMPSGQSRQCTETPPAAARRPPSVAQEAVWPLRHRSRRLAVTRGSDASVSLRLRIRDAPVSSSEPRAMANKSPRQARNTAGREGPQQSETPKCKHGSSKSQLASARLQGGAR